MVKLEKRAIQRFLLSKGSFSLKNKPISSPNEEVPPPAKKEALSGSLSIRTTLWKWYSKNI
jgi:hypothetical protein